MAEKIQSWDALKNLKNTVKAKQDTDARDHIVVAVGMATCGVAAGAGQVMAALTDEIQKAELKNVSVVSSGCYGYCYAEPMIEVRMPGAPSIRYGYVDEQVARDVVRKHLVKGEVLGANVVGQEVQRP